MFNYTGDRGRTDTSVRKRDFESRASANSATPAYLQLAPLGTKGGNRI